ncbi:LuxR C-terminal-related transcriptional regulator [Saccharopolyspora hattusasensis]|uniref:helix-turn-helix transcriptional regulator n=1 Tax=Saccharopolyspora hattusasensis TaxID=1128679 RepID=UPI003D951CB9
MTALVGRHRQLMTLDGMVDACAGGDGGVAVLRGGVGSGKTALLAEFTRRAAVRGARCLTLVATSGDADHWSLLDAVANAAGRPGADPLVVAEELVSEGPLVVVVDDLLLVGAAAEELPRAVARLQSAGALVVLADAGLPWDAVHVELLRLSGFRSIWLPALAPSGVLEVLAEHLDSPDAALAAEVHDITAGNPLLVRALVEDLLAVGPGERLPVTPGRAFGEVVLACLARTSSGAARLAKCVAVLGDDVDPAVLAAVLDVDDEELSAHLRTLSGTCLLADDGRAAFRSPAARAAVLSGVGAGHAADLRVRAADVLRRSGAEASEVAAHLLAAECAPDEWAVTALYDEAQRCLRDGELDLARRYLDLAAKQRSGDRSPGMDAHAIALGWLIDPVAVPRRLGGALDAVADGEITAHDAIVLTGQLLWHGWHDEAVQVLDWLAANEGTFVADDATDLRTLSLHIAITYPGMAGRMAAFDPGQVRSEVMIGASDALLRSMQALRNTVTGGPSEELIGEALRLLEVCTLRRMSLQPCLFALSTLIYSDELCHAEHWCDRLIEQAGNDGIVLLEAKLHESRAHVALASGDLPKVELHARRALTAMPAEAWGTALGAPLSTLVAALVGMGRLEDAATELGRPVPPAMFRTVWGLRYLRSRGYYYLHTGAARAALGDFRSIGGLMTEWGLDSPVLLPWRSDAAEVHMHLGERDLASRLLAEQARLPGGETARLRGVEARIRAGHMDPRDRGRTRIAATAVQHLETSQDRLELARALAVLGEAYRGSGDSRRAHMVTRRALHLATLCRADRLTPELTVQQRPVPVPGHQAAEGLESLSDAERRVAELASRGDTNREIARSLFITVSTVEQHLTRVYRKLKVRRRADLPADLGLPWQVSGAAQPEPLRKVEVHPAPPRERRRGRSRLGGS